MPPRDGDRDSAEFGVLVLIRSGEGGESIVFIQRPLHPEDPYSGQVCFPGGRLEPHDSSLLDCALREAHEELGVEPADVDVFLELPCHRTRLGHRVKPFAGRLRSTCVLRPSPGEVERVLCLPLSRLGPDLFAVRGPSWRDEAGVEHVSLTFDLEGHEVWGLTARILRDFLERLRTDAGAGTRPGSPR